MFYLKIIFVRSEIISPFLRTICLFEPVSRLAAREHIILQMWATHTG